MVQVQVKVNFRVIISKVGTRSIGILSYQSERLKRSERPERSEKRYLRDQMAGISYI